MRDEAFDTAEGLCQGKTAEFRCEDLDCVDSAAQLETDHRTEAGLLATRHFVAGMRGKAGIVDVRYGFVVAQCVDHRACVGEMQGEASVEGANATQREKAVEWCAGETKTVRPPAELLPQSGVSRDHRSAHDVAVSVEVLGSAVQGDVRAEREWLLERRREEGVVHDDEGVDSVPRGGNSANVRDAKQWIAGCLDPEDFGPSARDFRFHSRAGEVDQGEVEVAAGAERSQQTLCSTVTIMCRD